MNLSKDLNLELAWKRHKKDLSDLSFSDHPFQTEIIERNFNDWLNQLQKKLENYKPSRAEIVNIPKKDHHLRPGSILTPEDSTIYHALLLYDIEKIRTNLLWSASKQRFAHIIKEDQETVDWFLHELRAWHNFRESSLENINQGFEWVVFADVAACFENISIQRLLSDLRAFGISKEVRNLLSACLNRWAEPKSRGIPQGTRPSFILAEVYFDSIDRRLKNRGLRFCRYVDDIRLFCRSKDEAISALHFLTILLREKELNLQTVKSFLRNAEAARSEIDSISMMIKKIEDEIKEELRNVHEFETDYATPSAIERYIESIDTEIQLESIRRAFGKFFLSGNEKFDKTLFHY